MTLAILVTSAREVMCVWEDQPGLPRRLVYLVYFCNCVSWQEEGHTFLLHIEANLQSWLRLNPLERACDSTTRP